MLDVTARLAVERELIAQRQELLNQTETLSRILENIPIAVFIKDARDDFRITMWNRAAERIFQIPKADILGKNAFDLWPREQAEFFNAADRLVTANKVLVDVPEEPSHTKDRGTIALHTVKLPLTTSTDGEVDYLLCICEDITERKHLEKELRHNHKMEAIGRLTGHISHDFNNLLAVILGYSNLMFGRMAPGDPMRHMVEDIQTAAERGAALVRQLLIFGRKHIAQRRPIVPNAIVDEVAKQVAQLAGPSIQVIAECDPQAESINADPEQLHQLVMNLAVNAKDAMPEGGTLTMTTANVTASSKTGLVKPGRYVELTVRDTGVGMSDETRLHMFEPFFTTKQIARGNGLGLAIVHGIVEESGGHITVTSSPGEGSVFSVLLPQCLGVVSDAEAPVPTKTTGPRNRATVLVVDDDRAIREMFAELLAAAGFSVVTAEHGAAALAYCQQQPERIQLVLSDIDMPEMDGVALARELRRLHPHMRIVLMSGHPRERVMQGMRDDKGVTFLPKPIRDSTLIKTLDEMLNVEPPVA